MAILTEAVSVFPETQELRVPATLTLRLKHGAIPSTEGLRVFRRGSEGDGAAEEIAASRSVAPSAIGDEPAIAFSITRFGTYMVVHERSSP